MKLGGFLVVLFLIICFLWGVAVIVGGIRRWLGSWQTPEPDEHPMRADVVQVVEVPPPTPLRQPRLRELSAEPVAASDAELDAAMQRMRQAHALHREGVLTEEEFATIKAQLIRSMDMAR